MRPTSRFRWWRRKLRDSERDLSEEMRAVANIPTHAEPVLQQAWWDEDEGGIVWVELVEEMES